MCVCVFSDSEPPSSPQVVEDGGEEDEEELSGGEEADLRSSSGRSSLLTRRGITLRVLLKDGLVEPGDGVLAIHYLVITHIKPGYRENVVIHYLCKSREVALFIHVTRHDSLEMNHTKQWLY